MRACFGQSRAVVLLFWPISAIFSLHFYSFRPFCHFRADFLLFWPIVANFGPRYFFWGGALWPIFGCILIILAHFAHFRVAFSLFWPSWPTLGLHFYHFGPFGPILAAFLLFWPRLANFGFSYIIPRPVFAIFGLHFRWPSLAEFWLHLYYFGPPWPVRAAFLLCWPGLAS